MEVRMVLKRKNLKGHICFEAPAEADLQAALRHVLTSCRDKYNDYVQVTFQPPYKPRTTGKGSQNHHLNGHIIQICNATNNDYETIKYCVKMIAVEQMGYPFETVCGHVVPKGEKNCNTEECAKLIEASHVLAAQMGVILKETQDE